MKISLDEGDCVRHINRKINGGLQMSITEIDVNKNGETSCQCNYLKDGKKQSTWFQESDLILVKEVKTD